MSGTSVQRSALLTEAERLMVVCNSCRYCEGLCAVFPALEMRRVFSDGDLNYLANLCHSCGACYYDCQFSPPHEFAVNIPRTLAALRAESYGTYAWPRGLAGVFERNGLLTSIVLALCVAAFVAGFAAVHDPKLLLSATTGPGSFYALMPHNAMVPLFGAAFLFTITAIVLSVKMFWRDVDAGAPVALTWRELWKACKDAGSLRYLDGGGAGCMNDDEQPSDARKVFHHLTFYGFALCFASTTTATLYHYLFGRVAPYAWYDLPVVLGTVGGLGLVIGPAGLLAAKWRRDPELRDRPRTGLDVAFIVMLFLTSVTGLALLFARATPAMPFLLALHLGVVFALFVTMPYGKFVHGIYRFVALVRYAAEHNAQFKAASASTGVDGTDSRSGNGG
jgi:citrate/tricarballylate utilization protein